MDRLANGADVRIYRIVDQDGQPLDYDGGTDMNKVSDADHVVLVGVDQVPTPSSKFPQGGYIANDQRDGDRSTICIAST